MPPNVPFLFLLIISVLKHYTAIGEINRRERTLTWVKMEAIWLSINWIIVFGQIIHPFLPFLYILAHMVEKGSFAIVTSSVFLWLVYKVPSLIWGIFSTKLFVFFNLFTVSLKTNTTNNQKGMKSSSSLILFYLAELLTFQNSSCAQQKSTLFL